MQFVANGPDVPDSLLRQHEEGQVVLFAGAGVSEAAGLPGFGDLVCELFKALKVTPDDLQQRAICDKQYDTAIRLLEEDHVGRRVAVRRQVATILTAEPDADTRTHESLLTLGQNRMGQTRLITTNFDRLFERVIETKGLDVTHHRAPQLPVPKKRWDSLVYLHGLLTSSRPAVPDLDRLVLSSGDFGLAYLTEGWAARFVTELFRDYVVCFVGYSLNDPVLRYMTDALAADQLLGESRTEMFAFVGHSDDENKAREEWAARNVTPVLYRDDDDHKYLHKTLREWASTYRDGISGKERIIVEYARSRPLKSTRQDDYVGRVLWALSDPSGLPAKRFAELDPVPSLDWLKPLCEQRYGQVHLPQFGIEPILNPEDELQFSLLTRPTPYKLAPWMTPVYAQVPAQMDDVMWQLARWLTRHLGDPELVLWLADRGGQLHPGFSRLIEDQLERLDELSRGGKTEDLARIRADARHAVPGTAMRALWRLVLGNRILPRRRDSSPGVRAHRLLDRVKREGVNVASRMELQALLTAHVSLSRPFSMPSDTPVEDNSTARLQDLVHPRIVLALRQSDYWVSRLKDHLVTPETSPHMLHVFNGLLRDAMDLMRELGQADDRRDGSYHRRPSIASHPQNSRFDNWTVLVDLTRDAWLATAAEAPRSAYVVAESWTTTPYPLFRRLSFFCATHSDVVPPHRAVSWLIADDGWWLWSIETEREVIRLLVHLAGHLASEPQDTLEHAILAGPPSSMYEDFSDAAAQDLIDRKTWLRLAKMKEAGFALGDPAARTLANLASEHPQWALSADQRDEFAVWVSEGPPGPPSPEHVKLPRPHRALLALLQSEADPPSYADDWAELCRDSLRRAAWALCVLGREGRWPVARWREALTVWSDDSDEDLSRRSWRYMSAALSNAPSEHLASIGHEVGRWLKSVAKTTDGNEQAFPRLCRVVIEANRGGLPVDDSDRDPVFTAINHPIGHATEALLQWWYQRTLEDGQGLPENLRGIVTDLCDPAASEFRHGRVWLAVHVISLFRVDPGWTSRYLLPLFDWRQVEDEARAAWSGFLWSPRLYHPLFVEIKPPFLNTAHHYDELGRAAEQYAALLTFAALNPSDTFLSGELKEATGALPDTGLVIASRTLQQSMESAGSQQVASWENRIAPYLDSIWPTAGARKTKEISAGLADLCVKAGDAFPLAVERLEDWFQPLSEHWGCVYELHESDLCRRFPRPALKFLDALIGSELLYLRENLSDCLQQIREADSSLEQDPRFRRLSDLARGG